MRRFIAFCLILSPGLSIVFAQTVRATLTGSITDQQNAAIDGATVIVTSSAQGVVYTTKTNSTGAYTVPELNPGQYSVQVEAPGFRTAVRGGLLLQVDQAVRQDFSLTVGNASETIKVSGQGVLLNTEDSVVGQVISNKAIVELPLNGRNYLQLALLTTGVAPANGSRVQAAGGFSALGQHGFQTHVILDGVDNSSRASGGDLGYRAQVVTPSVDAIEEFKVVTNNDSAEYGFRMGGTVIVSTKSGSNAIHGSLFEFLRNDKLDAVNYFSAGQPKSPYRRNEFGGAVGGPILKDRTFYFLSYDGTRTRQSTPVISTVPLSSMLPSAAAPYASFVGQNPIYDPLKTTTNSSGKLVRGGFDTPNVIPLSRMDTVALNLVPLIPAPNIAGAGASNNFYYAGASTDVPNEVDARLDQTFSERYRASLRYSHSWEDQFNAGSLPLPSDGAAATTLGLKSDSAVLNFNTTISQSVYNNLSLGYSDLSTVLGIPVTQNLNSKYGITGLNNFGPFNQTGLAAITLSGFASLGSKSSNPNRNSLRMVQVSDKVFLVHGNHTFVTGFSFLGEQVYRQTAKNARGGLTFDGSYTQNPSARTTSGSAIADFLLGYAQKTQQSNTAGETATALNYSAYVQDNWRAGHRLTVNLGIRWDMFGAPSYGSSHVNLFTFTPGSQVYSITTPKDGNDCGCDRDWNNVAPRVGFAYQVHSDTVFRSGFGIVYGEPDGIQDSTGHFFNQSPYYSAITVTGDKAAAPAILLRNGFPVLNYNTGTVLSNVSVNEASRFIPAQYSIQWFADLEQQLGRDYVFTLSYLGSGTRHIIVSLNENQPLASSLGAGTVASHSPHPAFSSISYSAPVGNADYHALTAKIEKRFNHGFSILSSYTWSHAIDDAGENLNSATGQDIQNNYNLAAERGNSVFDLRNYSATNAIYELPFGNGRRFLNERGWLDLVIGGWQVSGILDLYSGTPFTPQLSTDVANSGTTNRPNRIGSGTPLHGERSISRWFDVSAFTSQTQYTFGNSGRDILSGPGTRNLDAKLGKDFGIGEGRQLDFRAEFFNVLNTPNFGVPNAQVDLSTAGKITTAKFGRQIQLGLKLVF